MLIPPVPAALRCSLPAVNYLSRNPAILGFDLHSTHGDFVGGLDRHAA